ncbi:hypothetical protein BUALT_Bualt01G0223600 [Buddleja alternifolia]|uniref:Thiolase C-terminal domain-containing protein n=1 Tax=Buddleja alternifolia TaxID=168488 RepID=A0AAV6YDF4_9LAMI|nr:hypothetical protein BUALT_Bualt01G0223600 [Buddleja alternifolia]
MVAKLGLHLIAKIRGFAGSVQAPVLFTTAPAIGTPKEISNSGLEASNIDFYEINEAFSSLSRLCKQIMGIIIRSLSKQYKLCIGRHRWAVIDKAYMHHTWRSSHSSDHLFLMGGNTLPSDHVTVLMDVLYLHSYETFRRCVRGCKLDSLPKAPGLFCDQSLADVSHQESLKAQKAFTECYNIYFTGVSRSIWQEPGDHADWTDFSNLVAEIGQIPILLTQTEKQMAREVCIAFRQGV